MIRATTIRSKHEPRQHELYCPRSSNERSAELCGLPRSKVLLNCSSRAFGSKCQCISSQDKVGHSTPARHPCRGVVRRTSGGGPRPFTPVKQAARWKPWRPPRGVRRRLHQQDVPAGARPAPSGSPPTWTRPRKTNHPTHGRPSPGFSTRSTFNLRAEGAH